MPVATSELANYLDEFLRISDINDSPEAVNGLQVETVDEITSITAAVDACQASIAEAVSAKSDLLLVHHGLFWSGLQPLTGRHGQRVKTLFSGGVNLYSAHIPLDINPEVGNNAVLAGALGATDIEWFGDYMGEQLGAAFDTSITLEDLSSRLSKFLGVSPMIIAKGPEKVSRIGVISGGGGDMIGQAKAVGVDTFVTGEGKHHTFFDAEEWGINLIYAGHYATETVGVKALCEHLAEKFKLDWHFFDHPTGL
ncbi:MAG: Nif3-like dinuclear metal center hexameric protein [Myxococcota bacterium]|nr:Nif3-like dinuclear metal center hexameric protein [Myxococcota bacterium]